MKSVYAVQVFTFLFGLAACGGSKPATQPGPVDGPSELTFYDSDGFDRRLASSLSEESESVTTIFPASITTNSIPERLDKWLLMIEDGGGKVELKPVQTQRGLITDALGFIKRSYDSWRDRALYRPAKNYNATIYYEAGTGTITQIVFTKKLA